MTDTDIVPSERDMREARRALSAVSWLHEPPVELVGATAEAIARARLNGRREGGIVAVNICDQVQSGATGYGVGPSATRITCRSIRAFIREALDLPPPPSVTESDPAP